MSEAARRDQRRGRENVALVTLHSRLPVLFKQHTPQHGLGLNTTHPTTRVTSRRGRPNRGVACNTGWYSSGSHYPSRRGCGHHLLVPICDRLLEVDKNGGGQPAAIRRVERSRSVVYSF